MEIGRESFKVRLHACAVVASLCIFVDILGATPMPAQAAQQASAQNAAARPVGTIKSISGNTITLTTDVGTEVGILVQDGTRLVRVAPGQKDLKDAAPIRAATAPSGSGLAVQRPLVAVPATRMHKIH
jgi:hypothetical protein